jgi:hypothetical protein
MAPSRKAQDLKAKEAKQKKILAAGLVLLVILMVVQLPKLMHHGGNVNAAPPTTTDATATAAVPTPTTLAPPTLAAAPGAAAAPSSSSLADTDAGPTPGDGQLVQFDLFTSKDPFVQQVKAVAAGIGDGVPGGTAAAPTTPAPGSKSGTVAPDGGMGAPPTTTTAKPGDSGIPMTALASLSVNGTAEDVQAGRDFPTAAPAFHLVSFTSAEAKISVSGGAFQSGAPTIPLPKGRAVTLMNTADGTRYVLLFKGSHKVETSSLPPEPVTTTTTTTPTAPAAPATTTTTATTTTAPTTTAPTG